MRHLRTFARFWYGFIIGDDWRVAAGVLVALALTWILAHADVPAWWLMPMAVAALLTVSVAREVRRSGR